MEQFSGTAGVLVMSDVVQREVLAHIVTEAVKAKSKLKGALEDVRNHWPTAAGAPTPSDILGTETAEVVTAGRMHKLDFGHVEPDHSGEDPTFEKY